VLPKSVGKHDRTSLKEGKPFTLVLRDKPQNTTVFLPIHYVQCSISCSAYIALITLAQNSGVPTWDTS